MPAVHPLTERPALAGIPRLRAACLAVMAALGASLGPAAGASAKSALTLEWTRAFDGDASGNDGVNAVLMTQSGTVYAAGYMNTIAGAEEWRVEKLAPADGSLLWSRTMTEGTVSESEQSAGALAMSLTVAGAPLVVAGSVSVTGEGWNWYVEKLDEDGNLIPGSSTQFSGAAHGEDVAFGVAVDGQGRIVVVGSEMMDAGGTDSQWTIRRYNVNGTLSSNKTWNAGATAGYDGAYGIARAYGGYTDTYKSGPTYANLDDMVVVGADFRGDIGQAYDWDVVRYNSALLANWAAPYSSPGSWNDTALAVACPDPNYVYVAGYEAIPGQSINWRIARYYVQEPIVAPDWVQPDWTRSVNGAASSIDVATCISVNSNNVFVGGFQTTSSGDRDWVFMCLDLGGTVLWTHTEDGGVGGDDAIYGISANEKGEVAVAGYMTQASGGRNWVVQKWRPGISLEVTVNPSSRVMGEGCQYTNQVVVRNTGAETLTELTVTNAFPSGAFNGWGSIVGNPAVPTNYVSWSKVEYGPMVTLTPGSAMFFDFNLVGTGSYTNSAQVDFSDSVGNAQPAVYSNQVAMTVNSAPSVTAWVNASKASYSSGETMQYTVYYSNGGQDTASALVLRCFPPANYLSFTGLSGPGSWAGDHAEWNIGSVAPGTTTYVTVSFTATRTCGAVTGAAAADASWQNSCMQAGYFSGTAYSPDATVAGSLLSATLMVSTGSILQGGTVYYWIYGENLCSDVARGVTVVETLPAGLTYVASEGGTTSFFDAVNGRVTFTLPDLVSGDVFSLTVTGLAMGTGPVTGLARGEAYYVNSAGLPVPRARTPTNGASFAVENPLLSVAVTAPATGINREDMVFTITVVNTGTATAVGVLLVDTVPVRMLVIGSSPSATVTGNVVSWWLGDIGIGGSVSVQVTARGPDTEEVLTLTDMAQVRYGNANGIARAPAGGAAVVVLTPVMRRRIYPLPFNPRKAVRGVLKFTGLPDNSEVTIFTLSGRQVRKLTGVKGNRLEWDGRTDGGAEAAPGIYLYVVETPGAKGTKDRVSASFGLSR